MARKLTYEEVRERFVQAGCELVSKTYAGINKPLDFICSCGNESTKTLGAFESARWCQDCGNKKKAESKKYSIEEVRLAFEQEGCCLLSEEYVNSKIPLDYICSCGEVSRIRFNDFLNGVRCNVCGQEKRVSDQRFTYDYVLNFFKDKGCTLLSKSYENSSTPLDYICSCGNLDKKRFNNFRQGQRCKSCAQNTIASKRTFTYEFVKNIFEDNNCELLETIYINSSTPMKYICSCGNISEIRLNSFQKGQRCKQCGFEKLRGENHPSWKHGKTDEERILERKYAEYNEWRKKVYERDEYTCKCCGKVGGKLAAHHLDGFNWCVERRIDITNGVTLCDYCHDIKYDGSFHNVYGNGNNTESQYNEWIQNKRKQDAI